MDTVKKFNESLLLAVGEFRKKCKELNYEVFDTEEVPPFNRMILKENNDFKNLLCIFYEPADLAKKIQYDLIGHDTDEPFVVSFNTNTKKLVLKFYNHLIIGVVKIFPTWDVKITHESEPYFCINYDDNDEEDSRYLVRNQTVSIIIDI